MSKFMHDLLRKPINTLVSCINPVTSAKYAADAAEERIYAKRASLAAGPYLAVVGVLGCMLAWFTLTGSLHPFQAMSTNLMHGIPMAFASVHAVFIGVGLTKLGVRLFSDKRGRPDSAPEEGTGVHSKPTRSLDPKLQIRKDFNPQGLDQARKNTIDVTPSLPKLDERFNLPQYTESNPNNPNNKRLNP